MRLRPYQLERWLYVLSGLLVVLALVTLAVGLTWPYSVSATSPGHERLESIQKERSPGIIRQSPSEAKFAAVWDIDLRKPMTEVKVDSSKPLPVKLVGTVIEPGFSQAMLQTKDGKIEFRNVGDHLAEVQILTVAEGTATILYYGQKIVLKVEQP